MDIVIGLPGSGKSSVYSNPLSQQHGSRIIDTDDFRAAIPEYNGRNAQRVHEEASAIRNAVLKTALKNGDNILLSTVGADAEKLAGQIAWYEENGYTVYLHLNELSAEKALARAVKRFLQEGRFVSPRLISEYGDAPTKTYLILTGQEEKYYGRNGRLDKGISGSGRESGGRASGDVGALNSRTQGAKARAKLAGYDWYNNDVERGEYEFEINGNILDAKLYNTGVNEVMKRITQPKANMLFHSDEIFRNARYLYSTPDYEGNPNIYRWNYSYAPVQIGDETVGVRIAVRDMAETAESQIYHWGIKRTQPWAVVDASRTGNSTGASSVVSMQNIPQNSGIVNEAQQSLDTEVTPVYPISEQAALERIATDVFNCALPHSVIASHATGAVFSSLKSFRRETHTNRKNDAKRAYLSFR